jgi:stage II sporulation protein D
MTRMRRHAVGLAAAALATVVAAPASADAASRFIVRGGGFGHGVGMSQYGALGFAQRGADYREILGHYYTGTAIGRLDADPTVRVLLQSGRATVSFTGAAQAGDRRLSPTRTYRATTFAGGTAVVLRSATGKRIATFAPPLTIVGPGREPVRLVGGANAGRYRGALELRPAGGLTGGLNVINAVGLEDYVRGVVAAESPASWPAEALKAQAVAARTYAITTRKPGDGFDHYADTRSQVYRGVAGETPTTDAAVAATRREVVTYEGQPVVTYFFSTSGGRTEHVENSFGGEPKPWLRSVEDPYDHVSPRHRWGPYRMTLGAAERKLRGLVKGRFRGITVTKRGASPRIVRAQIIGTAGRTTVDGATLRARLGLYDTWAYFTTIDTTVEPADETDGAARAARRRGGVVTGTVVGARHDARVTVERLAGARWTTTARTVLRERGRYRARVSRPGTYRVVVGGVAGPSVRLR